MKLFLMMVLVSSGSIFADGFNARIKCSINDAGSGEWKEVEVFEKEVNVAFGTKNMPIVVKLSFSDSDSGENVQIDSVVTLRNFEYSPGFPANKSVNLVHRAKISQNSSVEPISLIDIELNSINSDINDGSSADGFYNIVSSSYLTVVNKNTYSLSCTVDAQL